ncbi:hypothetical protein [Lichenicoccus roseus]|uniref:hypothetical protein n=1 Tax=Lichenicoccus roseus TaxID=2683649 RepID=UPI00148676A7|nr:hypothetical protein [Lichenicoccus roseus]
MQRDVDHALTVARTQANVANRHSDDRIAPGDMNGLLKDVRLGMGENPKPAVCALK